MTEVTFDAVGPGTTLGHFLILDRLGSGGMGVVYKARDTSLGRLVALKVLSRTLFENEEARSRFLREAHLASLLIHQSVATVYEVNQASEVLFIAMELVPGRNLKDIILSGPISPDRLLSLGIQICEALAAAHDLGIVHRDIKSSNVMVTPDDRAKVLDFGLAKALSDIPQASAPESDFTPIRAGKGVASPGSSGGGGVTAMGVALGTPSYMSPEQAAGRMVDARSDIFSLGVVLYEAATGRLAFTGQSDQEILEAVRFSDPALPPHGSPKMPRGFWQVLSKCLAKAPENRYASARQLRGDLERLRNGLKPEGHARSSRFLMKRRALLGFSVIVVLAFLGLSIWKQRKAHAPADIRTIGVLPFENTSGRSEESYLAASVPLELTSRLGQIGALKVVPWTFMKRYREESTSLRQIRVESGADAVLEGAVELVPKESAGSRTVVRIQTQLFDARTGLLIWASSFERDLGSFLHIRGEIAQHIAKLIEVQLASREMEQIASSRDVDAEAMALYLRGQEALGERTPQSLHRASEYFQGAVARDSGFAEAFVGLGETYTLLSAYLGEMSSPRAYRLAVDATEKALAIDDTLGEAWATQAFADYVLAWDWKKAEREFVRSLDLAPSSAEVHHWYADYLSAIGHHDEALVQSHLAEARSPMSPLYGRRVAWTLFFARRYDEAIEQLRKILEIDPDFVSAKTLLGRALIQTGRYDEGIAELKSVGQSYSAMLAQAYAAAGQRDEANRVLADLMRGRTTDPVLPYEVALIYTSLDDHDSAIEWLQKGFRLRDPTMVSLKTDPMIDPLRGDPRFEKILRAMNFPN